MSSVFTNATKVELCRKNANNKRIHSSYRYHIVPTRRKLKRAHPEK